MQAYTPEQISAFWTGVGAVAALIAAVATVLAAVVAVHTLWALKQDSQDRSRPYMSVDLRPVALSGVTGELVVSNEGATPARNVRVTFDPELPVLDGTAAQGKVTPFLQRRYAKEIPVIAPRRQLINIYAVMQPGPGGEPVNDEPTPANCVVTVKYEGERGREFVDEFPLTLDLLRNGTTSGPSGKEDTYPKRQVKALEFIAQTLHRR